MKRRLVPPMFGVADNSTFMDQPGGFAPPGSLLNVSPIRADTTRPQIGLRPGIKKKYPIQMGSGAPVQRMGVVSRSQTITGARLDSLTEITAAGYSNRVRALAGQAWALTRDLGMLDFFAQQSSPDGTNQANATASSARFSPSGDVLIVGTNYTDPVTTRLVGRITAYGIRGSGTGAIGERWSHKISRAVPAYVNHINVTSKWVFVCTNEFVRVLNINTGAQVGEFNVNGWSNETIATAISADERTMYIAFKGTATAQTLSSGVTVSAGVYASMWRSGVMKCYIPDSGVPYGVAWSPQLPASDRYSDQGTQPLPHYYMRFSEQLAGCGPSTAAKDRKPKGRWPTAIAIMPDGSVVVSHTNTGWGPSVTNTHVFPTKPSNDYAPPGAPYDTLSFFDAAGNLIRSVDTFSIQELKADGFRSDIPQDGTQDPSVLDMAVGTDGTIVVGGRVQSALPANVYGLTQDGLLTWAMSTGQTVRAVAFTLDDNYPIVGGDRSTTWPGASGANRHLWKLDRETGAVIGGKDLAAAVSCLSITTSQRGDVAYGSDKV